MLRNWFGVATFACLVVLFYPLSIQATMSSSNYRIWSDGISSGGNQGSSASYGLEDTIGEAATGEGMLSTNYLSNAGLPSIFAEPVMLFDLSSSAVTFSPTIQPSSVSTASYSFTVSTNARFGYTVQVTEDGDFRLGANNINDVVDGSVTTGSNEYGLAVSGTDAAFADDEAIPNPSGTPLIVARATSWGSGRATTVTHKASVTTGFTSGSYSHVVTYIAIGNF